MLYLGPYEKLGETYSVLMKEAEKKNLQPVSGRHREAYLSDPRRVAPEKLKTIVRLCVEEKKMSYN